MGPLYDKFLRNLILILIAIYLVLSLPLGPFTGEPVPVKVSYPYDEISTMDFSPDGKILAVGNNEGYVYIWDIKHGVLIYDPQNTVEKERLMNTLGRHDRTPVNYIKISPDGIYVLSGGYLSKYDSWDRDFNRRNVDDKKDVSEIILWNLESGSQITLQNKENFKISSIAFSPDSKMCAASYRNYEKGMNSIFMWDTGTGKVLDTTGISYAEVETLEFTPDGHYLVLSYIDSEGKTGLAFCNLDSMTIDRVINTGWLHLVHDIDFSSDGSIFAYSTASQFVILDANTGDVLRRFRFSDTESSIMDLSPDGKYLAYIRYDSLTIRNVNSGKKIFDISSLPTGGKYTDLTYMQFSPDMKYLAANVRDISFDSPYSLSLDDYSKAREGNISDHLLPPVAGNDAVFLWDFQKLQEGIYVECFLEDFFEHPFLSLILWSPVVALSYLLIYLISIIIKTKAWKPK